MTAARSSSRSSRSDPDARVGGRAAGPDRRAGPLRAVELPDPEPGPGEVRVRVRACGVCRTDLHLAEGDLRAAAAAHRAGPRDRRRGRRARRRAPTGSRSATGSGSPGCAARAGGAAGAVAAGRTSARTRCSPAGTPTAATPSWPWCPRRSPTGCRTRWTTSTAAPLLCAGIVGYRALRRAELPPGGRLGIYGFGASAHVVAQVAIAQGAVVHVLTRSAEARRLALELGAASAGPRRRGAAGAAGLRGAVRAGRRAGPGGAARAGPGRHARRRGHPPDATCRALNYADELFREKQLRSVTANTRADGEEFLRLAAALRVRPTVAAAPARRGRPGAGRPRRGPDHRRGRPGP